MHRRSVAMRSSAQACEDLLARLFTDAGLRARFKEDPQGVGREFGLDDVALASLAHADWAGLELAARSYAHKRDRYARSQRWTISAIFLASISLIARPSRFVMRAIATSLSGYQ